MCIHCIYSCYMSTTINVRIDKKIKERAQKTLEAMGLDLSSGIKLFLNQVVVEQCIPFRPQRYLGLTRAEWDEEMKYALKHGKGYTSTKEMMDDILK